MVPPIYRYPRHLWRFGDYLSHGNADLCSVFIWGAWKTWGDLGDSYSLGSGIYEDTVTEMLLLDMWRRTRHLVYERYTRPREKDTGADWLWSFVSGDRVFRLLVQAKRLHDDGKYASLKYKERRPDQTNTLIKYAKEKNATPIFCFYNYWSDWLNWNCPQAGPNDPYWGVSVAAATKVKGRIMGRPRGDVPFDLMRRISVPWMELVCPCTPDDHVRKGRSFPDLVRQRVKRKLGPRTVSEVVEGLPPDVAQLLERRREWSDRRGHEREVESPERPEFLAGSVVVSDRPIERGD